jgi:hypothetical protein
MSHIDEGQLHAYLDGEYGTPAEREQVERHLETCTECQGRLESERKLRERAAAILSGSGPGAVSAPPFDDIVARSQAARVRSRYLRLNRVTALGWAAVIVLAVGGGWIARGTVGVDGPAQEITALSSDSAPAPVGGMAQGETPEEIAAPAPGEAEPAASGRGAVGRERSQPTAMAKSEAETRAMNEPQLLAEAEPDERAEEADRLAAVEAPAAPAATPERAAEAFADADEARDRQEADDARMRVAAGVRQDAPQDAEEGLARRGAYALDEDAWRVAGSDAAEQHLGGTVHIVPELPVLAYRVGEIDGVPTVRVIQQLPSGEPLELIQRRFDADQPPAVGRVESALEQTRYKRDSLDVGGPPEAVATVTRGAYLITGRAVISADSLTVLLETIPQ